MKTKYRFPIYCIAILLLAAVIADTSYWIYVTTLYDGFPETVTAYLSIFPEVLRNAFWLTVIEIYLLAITIFIFMQSIKVHYLKPLSIVLAALSCVLSAWKIFSLM
ncbi:hypothetical protein ACX0HA_16925 [Flavobacterium hauense]